MSPKHSKSANIHCFDVDEAIKYGSDAAAILFNIRHWLKHNKANGTNIQKHTDGNTYHWTYNSARAFNELFPYIPESTIRRKLAMLETEGVLISSTAFNKISYDRTKWWTIPSEFPAISTAQNERWISQNDEWIAQNEESIAQSGLTIPDINADINSDINTNRTYETGKPSLSSPQQSCDDTVPVKSVKQSVKEPSESAKRIEQTFTAKLQQNHPRIAAGRTAAERRKQALVVDDCVRLDKVTYEEVSAAVEWATTDDFWSKQFQSLCKLRQKSRNTGVRYVLTFLEGKDRYKQQSPIVAPSEGVNYSQMQDIEGWREMAYRVIEEEGYPPHIKEEVDKAQFMRQINLSLIDDIKARIKQNK